MKVLGITRKLDNLGRVVIPAELRRSLGWGVGSEIEIISNGDEVILRSGEGHARKMEQLKKAIENVDTLTALALLEEMTK